MFDYNETMLEFDLQRTRAYRVQVEFAPAYELVASLSAYTKRADQKVLELGPAWVKEVRQRLPASLTAALGKAERPLHKYPLDLLIWQCPDKREVAAFLRWLEGLAVGEMYERLTPYMREECRGLPRDLGATRDRLVALLAEWDQHYFQGINPAILTGLEAEAAARRAVIPSLAPQDLVEAATEGIYLEPTPGLDVVVLVPQYHFRPWNLLWHYQGLRGFMYPADALPPAPGAPPPHLLRLTRALADESRLRILRFLAARPQSFTEVVRHSGLAKSTVHHHLVTLRAAGLIRLYLRPGHDHADTYSLRVDALETLGGWLESFLAAEPLTGS